MTPDAAYVPAWERTLEPPECPDGWSIGPPDFVGLGVQRAGTSWWIRVVEAHPGIVRAPGRAKELHFFDRMWEGEPPDYVERYHQMFPRPQGAITGEWTPRYSYDFWALPLLATAAPQARILMCLRDPVERYLSGLSRSVRKAAKQDRPLRSEELSGAVFRSFYAEQLARVFEHFPREQVLVLQYERCRLDPRGQMDATHRFLGLDPLPEAPPAIEVVSRPQRWKPELPALQRRELVARLRADVARVLEMCPEIDVSLWPNFAADGGQAGMTRQAIL